jgi:ATP-binding cassette, subfamily C, bacterial CydC
MTDRTTHGTDPATGNGDPDRPRAADRTAADPGATADLPDPVGRPDLPGLPDPFDPPVPSDPFGTAGPARTTGVSGVAGGASAAGAVGGAGNDGLTGGAGGVAAGGRAHAGVASAAGVPEHRAPLVDVLRMAGNRHLFAWTLVGAVAQFGGGVIAAAAGGWAVGAAVEGRASGDLTPGLVALLIGVALAVVGQWLNSQAAHAFAFRHQAALRLRLFDGLERSAPRPVLGRPTGEVASVVMADVDQLEEHFAHLAPTAVAAAVTAAGALVGAALVDPWFALIFGVGAVAVAVVPAVLAARAAARGEALREELGRLNGTVVDGVRGLRELVLFRRVDAWSARIAERTRRYAKVQAAQARADGALGAITDALVSMCVVVALVVAVSLAAGGTISLAAATLAVVLVIAALRPVVEAVGIAGSLAPLRAGARRVLELIDQPELVADTASAPVRLAGADGAGLDVAFAHVGFCYEPGRPVLDDVTFTVRAGETVALVGASGAGKSTCANLLLRFWDVDRGAVTIGGHDLREVPIGQLRTLVGIVPQQVHLFTGTVADNLRIGDPEASDADLVAAARMANAHDFVAALPEGYATGVGEDGVRLSGGQRQRLAIARALLHDAPVLILDEAASNLDSDNERDIQAAVRAARRGRATLVIAHRLSTIRSADRIVVLDAGRVVEQGTHDQLLAAEGPYASLVARQHDGLLATG